MAEQLSEEDYGFALDAMSRPLDALERDSKRCALLATEIAATVAGV